MLEGPKATFEDPAATGEGTRQAGELVERLSRPFWGGGQRNADLRVCGKEMDRIE